MRMVSAIACSPKTTRGGFVVTVWTRGGNQLRYPGKYRVVENLPDVSPWSEH